MGLYNNAIAFSKQLIIPCIWHTFFCLSKTHRNRLLPTRSQNFPPLSPDKNRNQSRKVHQTIAPSQQVCQHKFSVNEMDVRRLLTLLMDSDGKSIKRPVERREEQRLLDEIHLSVFVSQKFTRNPFRSESKWRVKRISTFSLLLLAFISSCWLVQATKQWVHDSMKLFSQAHNTYLHRQDVRGLSDMHAFFFRGWT